MLSSGFEAELAMAFRRNQHSIIAIKYSDFMGGIQVWLLAAANAHSDDASLIHFLSDHNMQQK